MRITLIAAMANNRVIGRDGGLPWRLPADLRRFKAVTKGHQVVMGRKTFESLPGPLPNRRNIVVTRQEGYAPEGVVVAHSLEAAIAEAATHASGPDEPLFILGGATIYTAALPLADQIDLTLVDAEVEGDTRFPEFEEAAWVEAESFEHPADAENEHAFRVVQFVRAGSGSS